MAITSLDAYIASAKQKVQWVKTASRTTVAGIWFSVFDLAGNPGAGTLAGTSTTAGVVPTDATSGCPKINAFGSGNSGYVSIVDFGSSVAGRIRIMDMLFKSGAYAFNANTALSAQPSYSGRLPGGDYKGLEIWIEAVTAFTGNLTVTITYTNQDGVGSRTATLATGAALIVGRMAQIPLQAGDTGVQKIDNVAGSVASAGTFNVLVFRELWSGRVRITNDGDNHGLDKTGMPIVYEDSAIFVMVATDGTSSGIPELQIEIANG